jgi:hypothetical protein
LVRENVRFTYSNFTTDGVYYYSMLESSQVLQQKVDDGTVAFSYPLDTELDNPVKELAWDGVNFWSLETKTGGFVIRKWKIEAFICKQDQRFDFTTGGANTYDADAFCVEHYRLTLGNNDNGGGGYTTGLSTILVSDTSSLVSGDVLTFVRAEAPTQSRSGTVYVEQKVVQSVLSATQVVLTSAMSADPHSDGKGFRGPTAVLGVPTTQPQAPDSVFVTKRLWIINKYAPSDLTRAALYKVNSYNGSVITTYAGTQYQAVGGATFHVKYDQATVNAVSYNTTVDVDSTAGGKQVYLLIAKATSMLFYNVDTNVIDRSLVMNNVKEDTLASWNVYDIEVAGIEPNIVIYRLQNGTTYKNVSLVDVDESWSTYNYEKQLLRRYVNAISVVAEPSIIPADGVSTSIITATLTDQYNNTVPSGKQVNWSDDSGQNRVSPTSSTTDAFGKALTTYTAGTTEQDVKITAGVVNGLIS